ncbi:protein of unknown function DUF1549 [Pirellula staleyi DSM 6068]|uniref:Cytochrome c domain-containing protein n=1 Tax=Pirellula staleyi (strain ATCC 27377 / DSM 6068 / ICPB 4128) TaxID=530564 RepID=D2R1E4_PIRSD|nr:protein of unknown function DUF1549 [Pirellula staleyi DSM 6068]
MAMTFLYYTRHAVLAFVLLTLGVVTPGSAAESDPTAKADGRITAADLDFFEKKIRPVLVSNCYQCHSASSKEVKGGLRVDTKLGIRKGGDSGPAVVARDAAASLLLQAMRHENGMEMPPGKKLPDSVLADFEHWISRGAPDPRAAQATTVGSKINLADARKFWSFQPVKVVPPAAVKNPTWAISEIDRYILAQLEAANLAPVKDADPITWLRRVTLDLTGLLPTHEEIAAFQANSNLKARAAVVDRLLASPQFGERWGRHWLDLARYGESTGKERNVAYPHAWRYRDYVIDSFNADKPYDEFLKEQLAGDLLPAKDDAEKNEHLTATGFLAIGPKSLNERNREQFLMDVADEQLDVSTRAVLGLSVACARCHDHKFDPIPTTEYYAMVGIFRSTEVFAGVKPGNNQTGYKGEALSLIDPAKKQTLSADERKQLAQLRTSEEQLQKQLVAARQEAGPAADKPKKKLTAEEKLSAKNKKKNPALTAVNRLTKELAEIRGQIAALEAKLAPPGEPVMAVRDASDIHDVRVNIRGEVSDLGDVVPRGYVRVITTPMAPSVNPQQSGRLQLAAWMTSKNNPLTARVFANRVWQHLFGRGLVETVDNFGAMGELPTHPELLDYLASRFMENQWSIKSLVREVVLTRAYALSSEHSAAAYEVDPDNKLVWHMSRKRLEAEVIRDCLLAASGELDLTRPAASLVTKVGEGEFGRGLKADALKSNVKFRSVYLPLVRGMLPDVLSIFDVADPEMVVGQRDVTTVATQALFLMNSPVVAEASQRTATLIVNQSGLDNTARARLAFERVLARNPSPAELAKVLEHVESCKAASDSAVAEQAAWTDVVHALFSTAEFRLAY